MRSLEERRLFILEAGCCGGDGGGDEEAPMGAGEEEFDANPKLSDFLKKRKTKRKRND